jgi:hypothetical protein
MLGNELLKHKAGFLLELDEIQVLKGFKILQSGRYLPTARICILPLNLSDLYIENRSKILLRNVGE